MGLLTTREGKKALGGFACFVFSFPGSVEELKQALIFSNAVKVTKPPLNSRPICRVLLRHKCKQDRWQINSIYALSQKKMLSQQEQNKSKVIAELGSMRKLQVFYLFSPGKLLNKVILKEKILLKRAYTHFCAFGAEENHFIFFTWLFSSQVSVGLISPVCLMTHISTNAEVCTIFQLIWSCLEIEVLTLKCLLRSDH